MRIFYILFLVAVLWLPLSAKDPFQLHEESLPPLPEGGWSVVVVPDTQVYTSTRKDREENIKILEGMFDWMTANAESRNIKAVLHVGDMTSRNEPEEWEKIRNCYQRIDGVLPYVLCLGNHDEKPGKRSAHLNEYFSLDDNPLNKGFFVTSFEKGHLENTCYSLEQNGQKYLFLALEFAPRDVVVEWADRMIKNHYDHKVIIVVHEYLSEKSRWENEDGVAIPEESTKEMYLKRYAPAKGINMGVDLKRKLIDSNPNVEFLVNGHYGGHTYNEEGKLVYDNQELATAHTSISRKDGSSFHAMLFNAQWIRNGGDGWLLLLEFQPDNKLVQVRTWSPYLNAYRTGPEYDFVIDRTKVESREITRVPVGPQVRIIPLASPLKSEDGFAQWMHPEYTAEDILEKIEVIRPQVLERYFTGKQDLEALVPVREGNPPMSVKEFLDASVSAGAPGCIIIPKLNLTWFSWGKEKYFWEAAENNYNLSLERPIRIVNLDNWKAFIDKHGEEQLKGVLERLKRIGYETIGVNMTGGYRPGFGMVSFADFPIDSENWKIRTSTLDKFKADPDITQYYLYIDYPGQMDKFMELTPDEQADVITKVIEPAAKQHDFTFVYPVLFDRWDASKHVTRSDGPYKGSSILEVIQQSANPDAMTPEDGKLHLFILAGQSNMKRMLPFDTFTPTVTKAFSNDEVVVVRNAVGGVPIRRWYKDWQPATEGFEYDPSRTGQMYNGLQRKLAEALEGRKPDTVTLVFMQGERDASDGQQGVYKESLLGFVSQLKTDLDHVDINFVIGRLSDTRVGTPGWDAVRQIQMDVATSYDRGAWVNTDDLNQSNDPVHYTDDGYRKLGERFADKAILLIRKISK